MYLGKHFECPWPGWEDRIPSRTDYIGPFTGEDDPELIEFLQYYPQSFWEWEYYDELPELGENDSVGGARYMLDRAYADLG